MAWRFRRRLRVMPGVYLNLGKRGASVSVGVRGAHMTFGQRGKRTTVGLPGSGISYTAYEPYSPPEPAADPGAHPASRPAPLFFRPPLLLAILFAVAVIALVVLAGG